MFKRISFTTAVLLVVANLMHADGFITVIKVNGPYAIISKGQNQGVYQGDVLFVKRETRDGWVEICEVKVIRTTANRAAIEQIGRSRGPLLRNGDVLVEPELSQSRTVARPASNGRLDAKRNSTATEASSPRAMSKEPPARPATRRDTIEPIVEPIHDASATDAIEVYRPPSNSASNAIDRFRKPWLGFNVGGMFPGGQMGAVYSTSPKFGLSYMVATGREFNLGIEVNHSSLSGSTLDNTAAFSNEASSMLEALVVFQKFLGEYFFLEGGGGIFRPKLQLTSIDGVETTYSSTHLGFVGGGGVFVSTSPFAGFTMKGRLHNYFDQTSKHYFGLSGGFRFKIR